MDFGMMAKLYPPAREIAGLAGTQYEAVVELLQNHRRAMYRLLAVCAGRNVNELPAADASEMLRILVDAVADGLFLMIKACRAAGEDIVCTTLYQYRPEDPEALVTLIKRRLRDDKCTHYMANALRLLVLSKLEKGSSYPTLREVLEPRKAEPEKTGMDIFNDIFNAVTGGKENITDDH